MKLHAILLATGLTLSACAPSYTLVGAAPIAVARNTHHVTPGRSWNKTPKGPFNVAWEGNWTENGMLLDSINFIGGLPDGQTITKHRRKDDRQVPVFHATMTPQDLVSMIETYYRIKAGATVFETKSVVPTTFLGKPGLAFDYAFVGADQVRRRGRSIVTINGGKLYMMSLDGAELHYFNAALPEFDAMTTAARLK
jgi:hypothetical protein